MARIRDPAVMRAQVISIGGISVILDEVLVVDGGGECSLEVIKTPVKYSLIVDHRCSICAMLNVRCSMFDVRCSILMFDGCSIFDIACRCSYLVAILDILDVLYSTRHCILNV